MVINAKNLLKRRFKAGYTDYDDYKKWMSRQFIDLVQIEAVWSQFLGRDWVEIYIDTEELEVVLVEVSD